MNRYLILISALCLFAICHSMAQVNQMDGNFMKDWLILGPFSGNNIDQDYLKNVGGEANVTPKAGDTIKTAQSQTLTWNLYRSQRMLLICCRQLVITPTLRPMHFVTYKVNGT